MNQLTQTQKPTFSLAPSSLQEAMDFANMLSKSNLVPKDYQGNPSNCIIAMQWGFEIGLQPLQAMQSIAVINGRPAIWGDAMLALVRGSGLLEYIHEEPTDDGCTVRIKRKGEPEAERTFTKEDAKKAGLSGKQGPWTQYPKRMMQLRARAFALRDVFPDVLRGVFIAEEAQDMPSEKHMGTADEVQSTVQRLDKPASRADKARAAVASRKAETPATTLEAVLNAIHAATTPDSLKAAAASATQLASDEDKAVARNAYANRKAELMQGLTIEASTGEILQPTFPPMAQEVPAADQWVADYDTAQAPA
ncbi:MAG: recombinase RecT [Macromonas sp.]